MLRGFLSVAAALLCSAAVCVAQRREVEGSVADAGGRPVPFATVTASTDSAAAQVVAYAVAAADGSFKVRLPDEPGAWWLTARSVGFRPDRRRLTPDGPLFVRFRLAEDRRSIADVVVTGATLGVKVGNDTVRFNPAVFKTGSEQSMADVISKLPGVAVQSDGSMTFRGKKIDKFLVDGKEALSGGGSTKTLPPDFAESIEMLENYTDGNVADAFSTRRQTAMNLKTDGSRQAALYASAAGGLRGKFDTKGSAFMFGKAGSGSAMFNANNTGEPVFSMMDYINASGGISNVSENVGRGVAVTLSNEEVEILTPSSDEDRRLSGVASANATYENLRGYGVGVSLIGHAMGADAREASGVTYHLPGGGDVFSSTTSSDDKASRLFAGFVNQKLDRRGLLSLRAKTKFLWGRSSDDGRYSEMRDGVVADHFGGNTVRSVGVEQDVSLSLRLGDHLLYAEAKGRVRHAATRTEASAGRDLPAIFARGAAYGQERENDEWGGGGNVGAIWMLFRGVGLKGEAGFTADGWRLRTDDGQPAETLVNRDAGFYLGLSKGKGLWQFDAGARWAALWRTARIDGVGRARRGFLSPSLRSSWEFSKSSKLAATASYGLDRREMSVLSRKTALLDYDEVRRPSEIADVGARVFDATLFYTLISQFSRVMMYAMATYSKTSGEAVAEYTTDGMVSAQAYVGDDGNAQEVSLRFYVNKGIASLPLELRVSAEFETADGSVASAGRRGAQETLSANGSVGLTSRFRQSPVNAAVSASRSWARSEIVAFGIKSDAGSWRARAELMFSRGAFSATLAGKWGLSVNDSETVTVRDADFEAAYKWRRLTFRLTGVDVCHLDGSDWLSRSANPNRTVTSRSGQMPGRIMAGVAFNK